jgi:lincosamide nucleotidyltransferase A/C/D/E
MEASEVARLESALDRAGIAVWLDGGWGVDALLEEQVREHDDLDLVIAREDVPALVSTLREAGYAQAAGTPPMSFVLVDAAGRQVDVHPVTFDEEQGGGVYLMCDGRTWVYPATGFEGRGRVNGRPVRCLSPEVQVLVHSGYELSAKDYRELDLLRKRFAVEVPGPPRS